MCDNIFKVCINEVRHFEDTVTHKVHERTQSHIFRNTSLSLWDQVKPTDTPVGL